MEIQQVLSVSEMVVSIAGGFQRGIKSLMRATGLAFQNLSLDRGLALAGSHIKFSSIILEGAELGLLAYSIRKGKKERPMKCLHATVMMGSIASNVAGMISALGELQMVASKVAAVAGSVGLGLGIVVAAGTIAIDAIRLTQMARAFKKLDLEKDGISFKALYGVPRSEIQKIEDENIRKRHMQERLVLGMSFRTLSIVAAVVTIVALSVLLAAGGPVGWGLLGAAAAISLTTLIAKLIADRLMNQKLQQLVAVKS